MMAIRPTRGLSANQRTDSHFRDQLGDTDGRNKEPLSFECRKTGVENERAGYPGVESEPARTDNRCPVPGLPLHSDGTGVLVVYGRVCGGRIPFRISFDAMPST